MRCSLIFYLISLLSCIFVDSIEFQCEFRSAQWHVIGSHYQCEIKNQNIVTDKRNCVVNSVTGNHQNAKSNADVKVIDIYSSTVNYFPLGMEKFFKNLEGITITASDLKEIRKNDLKPFTNLKSLQLTQNELEVIEPNLFEKNLNLESIILWGNKIYHIDPNVFDHLLNKLRWLQLNDNVCQFENSFDNIKQSNMIIAQIQTGTCTNVDKLVEFIFKSGDADFQLEAIHEYVEETIKKLEKTMDEKIEKSGKVFDKKMEDLKQSLLLLF